MKMNRLRAVGLILALLCFSAFAGVAWAQEVMDYEEDDGPFSGIMNTAMPMISDVSFAPAQPKVGEAVKVTCKIVMSEEEEGVGVAKAQIVYSTDGKTLKYADMTAGADGQYTGEIPGQAAGTQVAFGMRAEDTTRNVSMEMPVAASWPASREGLVPGAADVDNSADLVPDDMDFLQTYFGLDDEWVYVGFDVQGKVSGGTMDPPYIQVYGAKFTNPDVDQGEGLMVGKLAIYVPLASELFEKFKSELDKVGFKFPESKMGVIDIQKIMSNPREGYVTDAAPEARVEGGLLTGRLRRAALGDNPAGYVRCIYITAANASVDSFMPIPMNATPYTQIYTTRHKYTVAGGAAAVASGEKREGGHGHLGHMGGRKKRLMVIGMALCIVGAAVAMSN